MPRPSAPDGDSRRKSERSGHRDCPHAPLCVGCPYYGIRYGEQLERKQRRVIEALEAHAPSVEVEVERPVRAVRLFGYRNQVKLVARASKRGFLLGVYKPGTHRVVDVSQCPVHDDLVARALATVHRLVEQLEVPIYDERSGEGWLRYVGVRSSWFRRTTQVVLVVRDRTWRGERELVERLRRSRGIGSVVLNVNPTSGNTIYSRDFVPMTRHDALIERIGAIKLKYRAGSFVQANLGAARRAYEKVTELAALDADDVAVDLYCGVGAISLHLAGAAKLVVGVEYAEAAVRDAVENTRLNGVHNARFRAGDVAETIDALATELPRADVVTLNPPRKGAGAEAIGGIVRLGPRRIVYMSCDPESLARDLERLASAGYRTASLTPFDFLPQTDHVECVALALRE